MASKDHGLVMQLLFVPANPYPSLGCSEESLDWAQLPCLVKGGCEHSAGESFSLLHHVKPQKHRLEQP